MTFSLAVTGIKADQAGGLPKVVTLPDASAHLGGQQNAMMTGAQILCLNPDGSQSWYVIDAGRSTANLPVLRKV